MAKFAKVAAAGPLLAAELEALGKALGAPAKQLYVGVEYDYWKNKYGIEDSGSFKTNQDTASLLDRKSTRLNSSHVF